VLRHKNPRKASNLEKKIPCTQQKKNIFKRSENAIIGGTTEPTSPSLGIKSSTQTGLVFVFNHLWLRTDHPKTGAMQAKKRLKNRSVFVTHPTPELVPATFKKAVSFVHPTSPGFGEPGPTLPR